MYIINYQLPVKIIKVNAGSPPNDGADAVLRTQQQREKRERTMS